MADLNNIILQVGAKVLLKNSEGKYLLLRRNPKKYPEVGVLWDLPGGRIELGTTLLENLKREVFEETELELSSQPKLVAAQDIFVHRYTDYADNTDRKIERHVVRLTYIGSIDGNPSIDADHMEAGWFTAQEIKTMENLDAYFKELIDNGSLNL